MKFFEKETIRESCLEAELQNVEPSKLLVENVSRYFAANSGDRVVALDNVNLSIEEGEFICFVGPSGCGKSTLLNLIAGLDKADKGSLKIDGKPINGTGRERMVMFQEHALFPWLDVFNNVMFGLRLKPNLNEKERASVARYYLHLVGLERYEKSSVHQLSGGMRQRVALARALAPNPNVLLMDEPFAALDAMTRENLYGDLQKIWQVRRKTIVFVTHNIREAVCLGDRIVLFSSQPGKICEEFKINLPRPRNINDPKLSEYASTITAALKNHLDKKD